MTDAEIHKATGYSRSYISQISTRYWDDKMKKQQYKFLINYKMAFIHNKQTTQQKAANNANELLQIAEMFYDFLSTKNTNGLVLNMVKNTIQKCDVVIEEKK